MNAPRTRQWRPGDAVMIGVKTGRIVAVRLSGAAASVRWFDGSYSTVQLATLKPAADHAGGPKSAA